MGKARRVARKLLRNIRTLLTKDLDAALAKQSSALAKQSRRIAQLSDENHFLFTTYFSQDLWLANAKDRHKGERCFLLGTGPSLNKVDLSKLRGEWTMGVNGTFMLESLQLDYFVSVSYEFWQNHVKALKSYCPEERRFLPSYLRQLASDCPTTWLTPIELKNHHRVEKANPWFFSTSADRYVVLGGTVMFACLQILYYLGFSEVILLGVDHNYSEYGLTSDSTGERGKRVPVEDLQGLHFTSDYYQPEGVRKIHIDLTASERAYQLSYEAFENAGRKILNASPGTKLETFPKVRLEDVV